MVVRRVKPVPPRRRAATENGDPRIVIEIPDGTFDVAIPDLGDLQREMEAQMAMQAAALREMESTQPLWARGHEEELRKHLRLVEQQAEAFRLEAERARRQMEREVWTRLAPPVPPEAPAPVVAVPPTAPAAPLPRGGARVSPSCPSRRPRRGDSGSMRRSSPRSRRWIPTPWWPPSARRWPRASSPIAVRSRLCARTTS